jgi:hypothetical protein
MIFCATGGLALRAWPAASVRMARRSIGGCALDAFQRVKPGQAQQLFDQVGGAVDAALDLAEGVVAQGGVAAAPRHLGLHLECRPAACAVHGPRRP